MSNSLEMNKIFAAILTAGVTFGAVTSSGSSTFTVNNPVGGGTTLMKSSKSLEMCH